MKALLTNLRVVGAGLVAFGTIAVGNGHIFPHVVAWIPYLVTTVGLSALIASGESPAQASATAAEVSHTNLP